MNTIMRKSTSLNNQPYYYLETNSEGPVILCLHGRCGRGQSWYSFMQHFGDDYRVIAPDQRGHGFSFKPDSYYTAKEMAEDIVLFIKTLQLKNILLLGHSMGGDIAVYLSVHYPEYFRGIGVLDKSSFGPKDGALKTTLKDTERLFSDWPEFFSTYGDAIRFLEEFCPSDLSIAYFHDSLTETPLGYKFLFKSTAMDIYTVNFRDMNHLLPKIPHPTLLLRAKDSIALCDSDFEFMCSAIPNVLVKEMDHPDHNVHTSNPAMFYRFIEEFIVYANQN